MSTTPSAPKAFQIAAAVIGNALEWYDFIVFGFLTVVISRLFFPAESQYASLLLTTAIFAFAPTYTAIGFAAPLIIVLARLLQGLATGGEFASATVFLIESAPAHRRGFYGSWQMVGQGLAVLIGALLGALITRKLAPEALDSWGWRIPFLVGLIIGPVGLFIRRHLQETDAFLEAHGAALVWQSFGTMIVA